jgi:CDP-diglyceride synthetase
MILRSLDRLSLVGMALGVALMLQPWWAGGFALGFFVIVASTVGQIVFSHVVG